MLQDGQRTYMKHWIAIAFSLLLQMYIAGETHAAQNFYYTDGTYTAGATTDVGSVLKQTNQGGSILENLLDLFGINYAWPDKAITFGQVVVNYILALLGFIALILIIYAFAKIFFGKEDEEIKNARKTVIGASIALLVIGASAYIVNFMFYVFSKWY